MIYDVRVRASRSTKEPEVIALAGTLFVNFVLSNVQIFFSNHQEIASKREREEGEREREREGGEKDRVL